MSAVPRGKILAGRSIYRRRLLPTVSTRPRTPASTLMPDEEDERHVFNAGADLPDAEMTDGCESPILSVVRPSATSNTSHDIFDEHGRRFYRPALKANNLVALVDHAWFRKECAQTLMTRLGLHCRDAFDLVSKYILALKSR